MASPEGPKGRPSVDTQSEGVSRDNVRNRPEARIQAGSRMGEKGEKAGIGDTGGMRHLCAFTRPLRTAARARSGRSRTFDGRLLSHPLLRFCLGPVQQSCARTQSCWTVKPGPEVAGGHPEYSKSHTTLDFDH